MAQVQIDDQVFKAAKDHAVARGFLSVDAYVAQVVANDLNEEADAALILTPERLSELERISTEIKAGEPTYTVQQVQEHFHDRRKAWLAKHAT